MNQILKISEAASLALHTMVYLVEHAGRPVSVKEIAEALHRSEFHLSKVLQRLARSGLVTSIRGPRGGFQLGGDGAETTLLEIFEAIEGTLDPNPCILGSRVCCRTACILGGFVSKMNAEFIEYMSGKKLRHFIEGGGPSAGPDACGNARLRKPGHVASSNGGKAASSVAKPSR